MTKRTSGVWQPYDLGGGHELTGHSAPDLTLVDGTRLAAWLAAGPGLLLNLADDPGLPTAGSAGRIRPGAGPPASEQSISLSWGYGLSHART